MYYELGNSKALLAGLEGSPDNVKLSAESI
jgi:hypothetical protein